MKKKILGLAGVMLLITMLLVLTGCRNEKSEEKPQNEESTYIEEIQNMYFECDGIWYNSYKSITDNYTVRELMESQLENAAWSEETADNYIACVAVEGKDNGKTYKVLFNKVTFNKNETLAPYYDIYVDGELGKTEDFNNLLFRIYENYNKVK